MSLVLLGVLIIIAGGFFFLRDGLPLLLNTGSGEAPGK